MSKKYHTVARAIRLEYDEETDEAYLIFKIIDPKFKKNIREEWVNDDNFKLIKKDLVKLP